MQPHSTDSNTNPSQNNDEKQIKDLRTEKVKSHLAAIIELNQIFSGRVPLLLTSYSALNEMREKAGEVLKLSQISLETAPSQQAKGGIKPSNNQCGVLELLGKIAKYNDSYDYSVFHAKNLFDSHIAAIFYNLNLMLDNQENEEYLKVIFKWSQESCQELFKKLDEIQGEPFKTNFGYCAHILNNFINLKVD